MADNSGKILKSIQPGRITFPIIIGLVVTGYFLYKEFDPSVLDYFSFTLKSLFWFFISFLMMAIRDFGYIIRIRLLTNNILTWRTAFNTIMLWEFTSAITPSAIGGTSVAIFFINKEGVKLGRSTAVVMVTSFLDELYFILTFPLILLFIGRTDIFAFGDSMMEGLPWYKNQFFMFALTGYFLKLAYTIVISYGLFINPRGLKWLLLWVFKLPIIRRWRPQANESGTDLISTSDEFKRWPFVNWLKAFAATALSWTARYWIVNTLILAFFGFELLGWNDHILIFGKQLVMWIMMLVSPTPGGSGFAEWVFKEFLANMVPLGTGMAMAFMWRLVSYYPYLVIGAFVVPKWIRKHFITT
ncbi:flippase-like domain-containing protein [Carboxylicivirga sp. A043]|uniref:lysylphosphatidylglycerol synthase transmembrane domain-containing protein n=1 Tax=Carboxylicivirga litoralis TaxID=2816963 RepID=UPI0021CB79DF|nr:lysylphosphatidylglycerol synthase transmembrane domain-containing protein [Carboxylicivirga sp. A043]MCU4157074.1 flippase-like domain-containing protein [Carboxylicivirga sp. A043]